MVQGEAVDDCNVSSKVAPRQSQRQQAQQGIRRDADTRSPDSLEDDIDYVQQMSKEAYAAYRRQLRDQRKPSGRDGDMEEQDSRELQSHTRTNDGYRKGEPSETGFGKRPMLSESQERLFEQDQFTQTSDNAVAAGRRTSRQQQTKDDRYTMQESYLKEMELARIKQKRIDDAFQSTNPSQSAMSPSFARASASSPSLFVKMKPQPKPQPRKGLQPLGSKSEQNLAPQPSILSPPPSFSNSQHFNFSFDRKGGHQSIAGQASDCTTPNQFYETGTLRSLTEQQRQYYQGKSCGLQKDVNSPGTARQYHQQRQRQQDQQYQQQHPPHSAGYLHHHQQQQQDIMMPMSAGGKGSQASPNYLWSQQQQQPQLSPATRSFSPQPPHVVTRSMAATEGSGGSQQPPPRMASATESGQRSQQTSGTNVMSRSTSSPQFNNTSTGTASNNNNNNGDNVTEPTCGSKSGSNNNINDGVAGAPTNAGP